MMKLFRWLLLLLGLGFLAACGRNGASPAGDTAVSPAETPTSEPEVVPTATDPPLFQTEMPARQLEDGRFYALGNPDAPVTLTDYSDFL